MDEYDLLFFSESKISETDIITFPGFCSFQQPRKHFIRRSGGISIYFRNEYSRYIKKIETDTEYVLWIEIDKKLLSLDENCIFGAVYVPPESSIYFNKDEFANFENEITRFCSTHKYVLLAGDFNARTSTMREYTQKDDFIADLFDFDSETSDFFSKSSALEKYGIPLSRQSQDKHTNNHGYALTDLCKNNNLFILNGRFDGDNTGNFTFRKTSVIDYVIASTDMFQFLRRFVVIETDPIFSDGHCALSCTFSQCLPNLTSQPFNYQTSRKWNDKFSQNFPINIDRNAIESILDLLCSAGPANDVINESVSRISAVFENASDKTFPAQRHNEQPDKNKPWFGPVCKTARRKYYLARKQFHRNKTMQTRMHLLECSRTYKKTMNKYIAKYKNNQQKRLRNLQSKSPKLYWKFINSLKHKTSSNSPSLEEFYEHFKLINSAIEETDDNLPSVDNQNNDILNECITSDEICKCIRKLNNGKASGIDNVLNEYIKSTCDIFLPVYEKLFNLILDTGIFPKEWSIGSIHPIYKNKGNRDNVKNYRPITILSCMGKLFTSILNMRLNDYLEESMLLGENQAGFRRHYSTLDHIFSLHALIEILKSRKQKLFCCFVDFSSAFDSVWRAGLWHKLLKSKINGKVLEVIKNMYNEIKSCVSHLGSNSPFFTSFAGVRQGENLSPVLFSLYLNDLEDFLTRDPSAGLEFETRDDEMFIYLRLIVLLYADDTVLLANNEIDLQRTLNEFNKYCRTWKLNVNIDKTKVVVFGAKKTEFFSFKLGDKIVEITDKYKYLGIYFSQTRSFLAARKHIIEQARKAMFLLYCRIDNLNLPIDLQLKLFDHTVLPILTYACEIWSFENLDMIEKNPYRVPQKNYKKQNKYSTLFTVRRIRTIPFRTNYKNANYQFLE